MRRASGRHGVTLEAAFHHIFFAPGRGDSVLPQPHAPPGIDAAAFLEGRLSEHQLRHVNCELGEGGGLSFYSYLQCTPNFRQASRASMRLSVPISVYWARFNKYLSHWGLKAQKDYNLGATTLGVVVNGWAWDERCEALRAYFRIDVYVLEGTARSRFNVRENSSVLKDRCDKAQV